MNIPKLSSVSFKSTPIYDVKVKKKDCMGNWHNVDAVFSQLDSYNSEDKKIIKTLENKWKKTVFTEEIAADFYQHRDAYNASYYAIELKDETLPPKKRFLSLADVTNNKVGKIEHIELLQAAPNISNRKHPKYKGAGEVMIYGIAKKAESEGIKTISLESTKDAKHFYKHIGFTSGEGQYGEVWQLKNKKIPQYISRIENKYGFSQIQEVKNNE